MSIKKSHGPVARRSRTHAFTLTELLVVVVVVGLLAAILFPVLAQSREKARAANCFSNYHQVGMAMQMYATDYDGSTPPDGGSFGGLITDCLPFLRNTDVFTCPDDYDRAQEGRPGTYRMATLYQGKPANCGWPDPYSTATPPTVAQPSTTTLLYEAEKDSVQSPIVPTYRHSGGAQILYFDGHAKWVPGNGQKDADD